MRQAIIKQQFKRVNIDYDHLDRHHLTSKELHDFVNHLFRVTRDFKGDRVAKIERSEYLRILQHI